MSTITMSDEDRDMAMISTPDLWPAWPFLPLKHRTAREGNWPVLGFIVCSEPLLVIQGHIYQDKNIANLPSKRFASVADIVKEWMVD